MVAVFQQHVHYYAYWISFSMSCKTPLFVPNKKLFPYLYFLDYLCFPLSPLVFPGCPVFVCFPFCPLFFFCLSLFPVFSPCFHCSYLFSLVIPCFSCFPRSLFSLVPLLLSVFYCFPVLCFWVFSCFTLFLWILLSFPGLLCFSLFSWLAPKNSGSRNVGKQGKT